MYVWLDFDYCPFRKNYNTRRSYVHRLFKPFGWLVSHFRRSDFTEHQQLILKVHVKTPPKADLLNLVDVDMAHYHIVFETSVRVCDGVTHLSFLLRGGEYKGYDYVKLQWYKKVRALRKNGLFDGTVFTTTWYTRRL